MLRRGNGSRSSFTQWNWCEKTLNSFSYKTRCTKEAKPSEITSYITSTHIRFIPLRHDRTIRSQGAWKRVEPTLKRSPMRSKYRLDGWPEQQWPMRKHKEMSSLDICNGERLVFPHKPFNHLQSYSTMFKHFSHRLSVLIVLSPQISSKAEEEPSGAKRNHVRLVEYLSSQIRGESQALKHKRLFENNAEETGFLLSCSSMLKKTIIIY